MERRNLLKEKEIEAEEEKSPNQKSLEIGNESEEDLSLKKNKCFYLFLV